MATSRFKPLIDDNLFSSEIEHLSHLQSTEMVLATGNLHSFRTDVKLRIFGLGLELILGTHVSHLVASLLERVALISDNELFKLTFSSR